jgi:hypothetical protein
LKVTDIALHSEGIDGEYETLGKIEAKVSKASLFSKSPTIEDVNFKLQEEASALGANAVIRVDYDRGMTLMSYEVLKATGVAIRAKSDEVECPFCAEKIKSAAKICKHCRSSLS